MTKEELRDKIVNDSTFRRKLVRTMLSSGRISFAEAQLGIPRGLLDDLLTNDSEFEEQFSKYVEAEFRIVQRIEGWCRLNTALRALSDRTSDLDDPDKAIRAASALIKAQQALLTEGVIEEDDLDRIWKELTGEKKQGS